MIHYIFKRAMQVEMPLPFIGNVPRHLFALNDWSLLKIDTDALQQGDILFTKKIGKQRLISHVAIALNNKEIFHCSLANGKPHTEPLDTFFSIYEQKLSLQGLLEYIDHRDRK